MEEEPIGDLAVTSSAFKNEESIPSKYTCDGEDFNPPLQIDFIPESAETLAIIMEDPDAPNGTFDHWLTWNIPAENPIEENRIPGISGTNSAGKTGYYGPCPPSGEHRYYFHVFALDSNLDLEVGVDKEALQEAMQPHIVAKGTLMGRYRKKGIKAK
jgi:Raf kinase inhibitor-like YbhB/YbcL family protein